jgi:hypothetical protein
VDDSVGSVNTFIEDSSLKNAENLANNPMVTGTRSRGLFFGVRLARQNDPSHTLNSITLDGN